MDRVEDGGLYELLFRGIPEMMRLGEVHATERFNRLRRGRNVKFQMGISIDSGLMDLSISNDDLTQEEVRYAKMDSKQQKLYDAQVIKMKKKIHAQADDAMFRWLERAAAFCYNRGS